MAECECCGAPICDYCGKNARRWKNIRDGDSSRRACPNCAEEHGE